MARTLVRTVRRASLPLLGLVAAGALVSAAPASAAPAHRAASARVAGQLYIFSGTLAAAPAGSPTSLQLQVSGGNRPALRALVGNTGQPLSFAVNARTSFIAWTASLRGNAPTATTAAALKAGDPVHLRIRAHRGSPLARLMAKPVRIVNDFAAAQRVTGRMFIFSGRAVAIDPTAMTITIDVRRGNWPALNAMLGQPALETFHYDAATQFLSWIGRTPHTFLPTQIKVGDPITLRSRASFRTPLAALLSAPLWKVNDHEPSSVMTSSGANLEVGN
jgi:hypothetical protein